MASEIKVARPGEDLFLQLLVDGSKITECTFGELESKLSEAGIEFTRSQGARKGGHYE